MKHEKDIKELARVLKRSIQTMIDIKLRGDPEWLVDQVIASVDDKNDMLYTNGKLYIATDAQTNTLENYEYVYLLRHIQSVRHIAKPKKQTDGVDTRVKMIPKAKKIGAETLPLCPTCKSKLEIVDEVGGDKLTVCNNCQENFTLTSDGRLL